MAFAAPLAVLNHSGVLSVPDLPSLCVTIRQSLGDLPIDEVESDAPIPMLIEEVADPLVPDFPEPEDELPGDGSIGFLTAVVPGFDIGGLEESPAEEIIGSRLIPALSVKELFFVLDVTKPHFVGGWLGVIDLAEGESGEEEGLEGVDHGLDVLGTRSSWNIPGWDARPNST
ncbi:hypothetical protein UFOVP510_28 [uncultured Caudovirales phage]|uniref:Uncharacterized protein n=1 Tax=uncultured Caudovirales phage TaxID=2100421 RepID=A0A6J5MM78_9CAUD|nr:hypothetical protein UFOVP510_28 [uncultured Caudovirales phage]